MEWKTIKGFDQYRIYQDGHVYSCRYKIVLKQRILRRYNCVGLWKDGIPYTKSIHRLVAEHFIPNPENKPLVDHIDRDPRNNMYWNLRWATRSENDFNRKVNIRNKLGEKYIKFRKDKNSFIVIIPIKGDYVIKKNGDKGNLKVKTKFFKTLEEAIKYRNEKCKELDLVY